MTGAPEHELAAVAAVAASSGWPIIQAQLQAEADALWETIRERLLIEGPSESGTLDHLKVMARDAESRRALCNYPLQLARNLKNQLDNIHKEEHTADVLQQMDEQGEPSAPGANL